MRKLFLIFVFILIFILTILMPYFISGKNAEKCYAEGKIPSNFLIQKILVTKNNNGKYFLWLKFNNIVKKLNPQYKLYNYGFQLKFPNTGFHFKSKFLKYNNHLISGIELIHGKKNKTDVTVYFKKGIKINQKDVEKSIYKDYYVIKINHSFADNIFKNIGKKTSSAGKLALLKSSFKKIDKNGNKLNNKKAGLKNLKNKLNPLSNIKNNKKILNKQPAKMNFNFGFEIIKTIFSLLLVLGFIYAIYYLLTKFKGKISNIKKNQNSIRILSSVNIGFKKSLILASVNNQLFLIGVSPTNMQVIGHIKDNENNNNNNIEANNADALNDASNINDKNNTRIYNNIDKSDDEKDIAINNNSSSNDSSNNYKNEDIYKNDFGSKNNFNTFLKQHIGALSNDKGKNEDGPPPFGDNSEESSEYKIRNISEARIKNKADNVFFDIEKKIKGLMENNYIRKNK
ncbi:MAG: FliO/MopB family protein [bacterium]